ncbi:MAG: DUF1249 domain-containing protein [Pseudomonadota bacterium]
MNIQKPVDSAVQTKRYIVDLSATMAVCDANYIRLLKLMPDFQLDASRSFVLPTVGNETHENITQSVNLVVVEAFRYTSTIRIQMGAVTTSDFYHPPCILVRVYHDANTAEVVSFQEAWNNRVMPLPEDAPQFYPDEKEQINLFLAEWLTLCIETGLDQSKIKFDARTVPGLLPMS